MKRQIHTWLLAIGLGLFVAAGSGGAAAQPQGGCTPNAADEAHRLAIEGAKKFWHYPLKIDLRRDGEGFPDGAKGQTMHMIFTPLPPPPGAEKMTRTEIEDAQFRVGYCNATAIVRATPVCDLAEITPDFTAIYTRTRLQVREVIAANKSTSFKDDIFVTNFGGEVKHEGETIRLEWIFDGVPTRLRIGTEYLLMLYPLKGAGANDFHAQGPVAIARGKLDQHAMRWYLFRGGEGIADARVRIRRATRAPC
jgi:hypothetical protein